MDSIFAMKDMLEEPAQPNILSRNKGFFETLNQQQAKAVGSTEGKVRVIAGAGTGKTKVLTSRYAYLVSEIGINPSNVLCLTFTNKAANEMRFRINRILHGQYRVFENICTIHSFCVKVLRRDIFRLGWPDNFNILDTEDSVTYAKDVMKLLGLDRSALTVKQFLKEISLAKSSTYYVEHFLPNADNSGQDKFTEYIKIQLKNFSIDFTDIIYMALYLLEKHDDVRQYWQEKFNYIMVDEVQDCNKTDWQIIKFLCEKCGNLMVVGDPDQAIYEWRGADPSLFVNFKADTDIILNENYRSNSKILSVANSVISNNKNRVHKDLFTQNKSDERIVYHHDKSEELEAEWVAKQILNIVDKQKNYEDVAVMFRASYISRSFEQQFVKHGIPYVIWGGIRFYERKEIKDCIAYLKLVAFGDDLSFERVINTPSRKFGKASMNKLKEMSKQENLSLYATLKKHIDNLFGAKKELVNFITLIDELSVMSKTQRVTDILDVVLKKTNLMSEYKKDEDTDKLDNIKELLHSTNEYDNEWMGERNLNNYLQDIALYIDEDSRTVTGKVKLMTIHQSKGLEFPYVFVVGLSEGILPNYRSIVERENAGEEEERRLMYVAITRAEKNLILTDSEGFNSSINQNKYPSRFIKEIQESDIHFDTEVDSQLFSLTESSVRNLNRQIQISRYYERLKEGDYVYSMFFGACKVISNDVLQKSCSVMLANGEKRNLLYHAIDPLTNVSIHKINDIIYIRNAYGIVTDIKDDMMTVYHPTLNGTRQYFLCEQSKNIVNATIGGFYVSYKSEPMMTFILEQITKRDDGSMAFYGHRYKDDTKIDLTIEQMVFYKLYSLEKYEQDILLREESFKTMHIGRK